MTHRCLLGRECGLCLHRLVRVRPLPPQLWRTLLGPVAKYESSPDEATWRDHGRVQKLDPTSYHHSRA